MSADGRYVAFNSRASNLVDGDTNGMFDVFVRDRQTGATERVSVAGDGTQANGQSFEPSISADGRYVAFETDASNLAEGPTSSFGRDILVHDRQTGATDRVSVNEDGFSIYGYRSAISGNGRYVVFVSRDQVFVHDRETGATERVSVADDNSVSAGEGGNGQSDSPAISADGRYVAFSSEATNLVGAYGFDAHGNYTLLGADTNDTWDVFVRDRQTGATKLVSVAGDGSQGDDFSSMPSISDDGRYVAFASDASNFADGDASDTYDVFLRDRQTAATERVSVAGDAGQSAAWGGRPAITGDGRSVAYYMTAPGRDAGDPWDVFVWDGHTGATELVSVANDGSRGNGASYSPSISSDGRYIAFGADASNLVDGDTNSQPDVFVRDRGAAATGTATATSADLPASDATYGDANATLSAVVSGSPSVGKIAFRLTDGSGYTGDPVEGTVTDGTASVSYPIASLAAGTYTILASYTDTGGEFASSDNDAQDPAATLVIDPAPQIISFTTPTGLVYGGDDVALDATSDSGLDVTVTSLNPGKCSVVAGAAHPLNAGTCRLRATQAGDANHAAAFPVRVTATVTRAPLTQYASSGEMTYGDAPPAISVSRYEGFVNGDTEAVVKNVVCTTRATSASKPAAYPSSCTGSAANYAIARVKGAVVVSKKQAALSYTGQGSSTSPVTLRALVTPDPGGSVDLTKAGPIKFTVYRAGTTVVQATCSTSTVSAAGEASCVKALPRRSYDVVVTTTSAWFTAPPSDRAPFNVN
jgi:Tol biopolymer transport system component